MKVLVTGSSGQLGLELKSCLPPGDSFFVDHGGLDITDAKAVERVVNDVRPDIVINCAAYTAVDRAETERDKCFAVNVKGVENVASLADSYHFKVIHISTDYVFDGNKSVAYTEEDAPSPLSVYGESKLRGEEILMKLAPSSIVIRTGWLYSALGKNFVRTILNKALHGEGLRIVDDQIGTPTYARDLARAIKQIIYSGNLTPGIFNYSDSGVASWFDLGVAICEAARTPVNITPVKTEDYPAPALRPHFSVLDKSKIKAVFGVDVPYWRESLNECVSLIRNI